ncbi:MAG: PAS domain S-box protein [Candidatus Marinimicrobia bacterium]|nr:PAS domain S-box protein [Candidatus Neomarinimicrobiota bacterium]
MVGNSNSPKAEEPRPRSVLVVEDDEGLNSLAQKALRKAGYDTEGVFNGAAAIEGVAAKPEVVLLLDIKLPDMTGKEIINTLRERNSLVPFIVMTGHGDEKTAVEMMKLGAGDYLVKGLDLVDHLPGVFRRLFHELDTDRQLRAAEEALRESEEKHRTLFETMVQGVVYQSADGQIISANHAAERILGLTLDQMQGRTSMDPSWRAIHEDGSDFTGETHPAMIALTSGEEVNDVVMGVLHSDHEQYYWININAVPQFRPGEDKPFQVYTTFEDITERKRAEDRQRLTQFAVDHSADPIYWVRADGSIDYANDAACQALGYTRDELTSMSVWQIDTEFPADAWLAHWREMKEAGSISFESYHLTKAGRVFPVEINTTFGVYVGQEYIWAYVHDITERKLLEREVLEVSEKEQRRIGQILHDDLGQYLLGTAYKSELLEQQLAEQSLDEAATAAQITELIHEAINRSQDLAKELYPVDLETSNLAEALRRLGHRTEHLFDVSCHISCDPTVPDLDHLTATHLYRIAQEAVQNAIKHGGANRIVIDLTKTINNQIELKVSNNGIGLPKNWESRLGMGLRMMKHRASMCNGSFDIRAKHGGGTVVTCTSITGIRQLEMPEDHPLYRAKGNE